ncbi:hypothetical protein [Bartonella sp. 114]
MKVIGGRAEIAPILSDMPVGVGKIILVKLTFPIILTSDVSA